MRPRIQFAVFLTFALLIAGVVGAVLHLLGVIELPDHSAGGNRKNETGPKKMVMRQSPGFPAMNAATSPSSAQTIPKT